MRSRQPVVEPKYHGPALRLAIRGSLDFGVLQNGRAHGNTVRVGPFGGDGDDGDGMGRDGGLALALALSRGSTGYLLRTVYDLSTAQRQTADGNATPQLVLRWNAKKGSNVSCLRTPVRKYGVFWGAGCWQRRELQQQAD
jgi:hypothetical protein